MMPIKKEFTFNGVDLSDICVAEEIVRPLMNLEVTWGSALSHPDYIQTQRHTSKTISVKIRLLEKSFDNLQNTKTKIVKTLFTDGKLATLELYDTPSTLDYVVLDGSVDFDRFFKTGESTLSFKSPFDCSFSREEKETVINGSNGSISISNEENIIFPLYPKITIKTDGSSTVSIINQVNGEKMVFNNVTGTGQINVDSYTREMTTSGGSVFKSGTNPYQNLTIDSDFIKIYGTSDTISLKGASQVVFKYRLRKV